MPLSAKRSTSWWHYIFSGLGALLLGIAMQSGNGFPDPDSFYHIQITWQMLQHGLFYQFPWLYYTDLAQHFTDQHLLYHLLLAPWLAMVGPMVGAKIFQVIMLVSLTLFFHRWLRHWQIPHAGLALVVLFAVTPFCIRMNLVKASVIAVLCCYAILWCILEKRLLWAAALTLVYTWIHAGFVLAIVCAGAVWLADCLVLTIQQRHLRLANPKAIGVVIAMCIIGVVVSPYFPYNLSFLWQQLVQIGILNYSSTIEVGAEWYYFPITELVAVESIVLIGVVSSIAVSLWQWRKFSVDRTYLTLVILSVGFGIITMRSRRYVEYLTPALWLWACYVLLPYLQSKPWQELRSKLKVELGWLYTFLVVYFTLALPIGIVQSYLSTYWSLHDDAKPITQFAAASQYIVQHTQPGEIVFTGQWDQFPLLYFQNQTNYYIVGLDPTFMYLHNQELFQNWLDISSGKTKTDTAKNIVTIFHAHYVVIDPRSDRTKLLDAYLQRDDKVELVFQDEATKLYYIAL